MLSPQSGGAEDQEGVILENEQLHDQPTTNNCNNIPCTVTTNRPIQERKNHADSKPSKLVYP